MKNEKDLCCCENCYNRPCAEKHCLKPITIFKKTAIVDNIIYEKKYHDFSYRHFKPTKELRKRKELEVEFIKEDEFKI